MAHVSQCEAGRRTEHIPGLCRGNAVRMWKSRFHMKGAQGIHLRLNDPNLSPAGDILAIL